MGTFTTAFVRDTKPRSTMFELTCDALPGFILRVLPTGKKVFLVRFRVDGKDRRERIGLWGPSLSVDDARRRAALMLSNAAVGEPVDDEPGPKAAVKLARSERAPSQIAVRELASRFIREYVDVYLKPGTAENYRTLLADAILPWRPTIDGKIGMFGSLLNDKTFDLLHIDVGAATADPITAVPATLVENTYWTEADVTHSRTLAITDNGPGTPFTFDGVAFDHDTINQNVELDAVEKWTISNGMTFGHSFHIHDVQFKIVSRSSGPVADYEQGWKDVVRIARGESVSFVAKFEHFASDTAPYMYHCHMATHEDDGLMGQFLVQ